MKYRHPKTGEVFEDIDTAIWNQCRRRDPCDTNCPLFKLRKHIVCRDYVISHPDEAARRMGMEVVEDHTGDTTEMIKEEPMEKKGKPRICEVLGVEEFERICEAVHNGWWEEKKRQGATARWKPLHSITGICGVPLTRLSMQGT